MAAILKSVSLGPFTSTVHSLPLPRPPHTHKPTTTVNDLITDSTDTHPIKSNGRISNIFSKMPICCHICLKGPCSQLHNDIQIKCNFKFQPVQVSVIKFPCWSHEAAHSIAGKGIAVRSLHYLL